MTQESTPGVIFTKGERQSWEPGAENVWSSSGPRLFSIMSDKVLPFPPNNQVQVDSAIGDSTGR